MCQSMYIIRPENQKSLASITSRAVLHLALPLASVTARPVRHLALPLASVTTTVELCCI